MAQAEPTHNVVSTSCGGGDRGGSVTANVADEQYVTTGASTSMASCSHESSLYVTAGMDEVQIKATIEKSNYQGWSELAKVGTGQVGGAGSLSAPDAIAWKHLKEEHPDLFRDDIKVKLGRVIAEGGQAQIYEAKVTVNAPVFKRYVAKVFKMDNFSLIDFQRHWPMAAYASDEVSLSRKDTPVFGKRNWFRTCVEYGVFLEDGRFAFLIGRCWGDLRALIDLKLKNQNSQGPPFSDPEAVQIITHVAWGMRSLHSRGTLHRDLKAANVLIRTDDQSFKQGDALRVGENCKACITDYETSVLVKGTGFWRAPEVLKELQKPVQCDQNATIWTEKVDVYSYAMTCYEILTGLLPFKGYYKSDWDRIIVNGERPRVPDYVHPDLKDLMERCWHADPSKRPNFFRIASDLVSISDSLGLGFKSEERLMHHLLTYCHLLRVVMGRSLTGR